MRREEVTQSSAAKIVVVAGLVLLMLLGLQMALGTGVANLVRQNWPTRTPLEARFEAMRIQAEDLPAGWRMVWSEEVPEAVGRFYSFYGSSRDQSWVKVSQKLVLYPNSQAAADAYDGWVDRYIPPARRHKWSLPPELEFTGQADQMTVACLPGYINGLHHYACSAIGLYGDMVVVLLGNVFDERWLTMEDFQALLEAMDRRLVAAEEQGEQ